MSYCDCSYPEAFRKELRKARKNHRCCECIGNIEPKEYYYYLSGIWDGSPDWFHIHEVCEQWRVGLMREIELHPESELCECFQFGELQSMLMEFCREVLYYDPKTGDALSRPKEKYINQFYVA